MSDSKMDRESSIEGKIGAIIIGPHAMGLPLSPYRTHGNLARKIYWRHLYDDHGQFGVIPGTPPHAQNSKGLQEQGAESNAPHTLYFGAS